MNAITRIFMLPLVPRLGALAVMKSSMRSFWFHCALGMLWAALGAMQALGQMAPDEVFYPNKPYEPLGYLIPHGCPDGSGNDLFRIGSDVKPELAPLVGLYEICVPPGKSITGLVIRRDGVYRGTGEKKVRVIKASEFTPIPPIVATSSPGLATARIQRVSNAALVESSIPVSNDGDSIALTCDGRYLVVVGANSATPVSLVDLEAGAEVDTFAADSNVTYAETFDDGESVVVVQNIPPQNATNRLRRLKIVNGQLVDTGESLAAGPGDYRFKKVFAAAGSKVGVAIAEFGNPQIVTFSIPGLQVLDGFNGAGGSSGAMSCAGDKFYVRGGSQIRSYTVDPVTGALGDTPFLTINGVGETDFFVSNFGNALEVSRDGARLIVPEGTAFPNSPPTPRTTYFDTTTGARIGFFDAFGRGSPTLVSTIPCCARTGLRLGIQRLASGLIQITATGEIGKNYELQKSQNLVAWDKLLEFQMTASPAPYTDLDSQTNSTRFYRLKLIP